VPSEKALKEVLMRSESVRRSFVLITALVLLTMSIPAVYGAAGEEGWRKEFDDICGRTSESQSLSIEELRQLVDRCDKLQPQIEQLGESERKVFRRRLKMCRDLFSYVQDSKREGK
jgi:hypothetical protein